jgi:hypothetical protein
MAEYRTLKMAFWNDPFIEALPPAAKLLYLYLITSPHTNNLGVLEISRRRISYETGLDEDAVNLHLAQLEESEKLFVDGSRIWLANFVRHQTSTSPKMLTTLRRMAADIRSERLSGIIRKWYPHLFGDAADSVSEGGNSDQIPYAYPIDTVCIPSGEEEEEEEEEMEEEREEEEEGEGEEKTKDVDGVHPSAPAARSSSNPVANQSRVAENTKAPDVPYQAIVDIYHEALPELPRVAMITEARRKAMRSRWTSKADRRDLEWWRRYFLSVRQFSFLFGRNERNWTATFDFLIGQKGMAGVLEGKYADRGGGRGGRPGGSASEYVDSIFPDKGPTIDAEVVRCDGWRQETIR